MNITEKLAQEFGIRLAQVEQTVALIDEGNTIPFIARYRKEVTGGLTDVLLRDLDERLSYLRGLEERKAEVIKRRTGKAYGRTEKRDRAGGDTAESRRSVQAV